MARRSTRDRPAKAPLSVELVVRTGLEVLRAEGLGAVTMRRIAGELDTGPASLYAYVAGRDELLAQMLDAVFGTVPVPDVSAGDWRRQLTDLLTNIAQAMDDHPGIAQAAFAHIPTGPHALALTEATLALLRAGGVSDRAAAWAGDVLSLYVVASAYENSVYLAQGRHETRPDQAHQVEQRLRAVPPGRYPNVAALAGLIASGSSAERFAFGLTILIDGLLAQDGAAR